jgi:hypothetical protein
MSPLALRRYVNRAARAVHPFLQSADEDDNAKRILLRLRQFEHAFALDWKVLTREREDAVLALFVANLALHKPFWR